MKSYWFNPSYWYSRNRVGKFMDVLEANPWLMDDPRVRADLDWIVTRSRELGWLERELGR